MHLKTSKIVIFYVFYVDRFPQSAEKEDEEDDFRRTEEDGALLMDDDYSSVTDELVKVHF